MYDVEISDILSFGYSRRSEDTTGSRASFFDPGGVGRGVSSSSSSEERTSSSGGAERSYTSDVGN